MIRTLASCIWGSGWLLILALGTALQDRLEGPTQ